MYVKNICMYMDVHTRACVCVYEFVSVCMCLRVCMCVCAVLLNINSIIFLSIYTYFISYMHVISY